MANPPPYPKLLAERPYEGRQQVLTIFAAMVDADGAILLDSGSHKNGTFDLCAALPVMSWRDSGSAPFEALRQAWHQQKPVQHAHDLPFSGGLIGAFSYDLARALEHLPTLAKHDIALPETVAGLYLWAVIVDHHKQHCGLWQFGELSDADIQQAQRWFHHSGNDSLAVFALQTRWQANVSRERYGQAFRRVQDYIHAGDCYQINLAQRFSAHYTGHPFSAYRQLSPANRAPFSAYVNAGNHTILSLSPERFIRVIDRVATTEPIKGTRPRGTTPTDDERLKQQLFNSEKDRAENVMIVDLLRNDFGKNCEVGSVRVPELFAVRSYPAVHHLVSTVTGRLATNRDALHLFEGAFPGGSITGAPKVRAMQIIEELEPHRRSIYCGSIGYYDFNERFDSSITIRTLVCDGKNIHCWAGGGLVADSDEQQEYDETLHKVSKLLPLLQAMTA